MATTSDGLPYPVGTDLVRDGDNAIQALAVAIAQLSRWIKAGRVDRVIEGNGYLRLTNTEAWPSGKVPASITAIGINEQFRPTWGGDTDGSGCLLKVYKPDNTAWPPGATVAIYYVAVRPTGAA